MYHISSFFSADDWGHIKLLIQPASKMFCKLVMASQYYRCFTDCSKMIFNIFLFKFLWKFYMSKELHPCLENSYILYVFLFRLSCQLASISWLFLLLWHSDCIFLSSTILLSLIVANKKLASREEHSNTH